MKFGGGKSQKKAKVAAGGARAGLPAQAARLKLALRAKISSSFGIQSHHFGTNYKTVALLGGFFVICSELVPRERIELSHSCEQWILSPSCLPFHHRGLGLIIP